MKIGLSDHFTYGKLIRFTLPTMAMLLSAAFVVAKRKKYQYM